ncbi:hypothetical protein HF1_13890 [Mycoplasma haemofelis str. Langford 1]|uniref:Uncharacterized protein n=1 Tax=Mycoplasma haemofelis (strain Langford 1) TaxID=941640 RepID=E8ZJS6_MYCHL|nr:hypothetical protein [Mycoplasma haemofelis]CBY93397.1 hypothetical protein HF1_13890 [Mycoplasma haemofelis str. Langford 1]
MGISSSLKIAIPAITVPAVAGFSYFSSTKEDYEQDSLKSLIEWGGRRKVLSVNSDRHDNIWDEIVKEYKNGSFLKVDGISKDSPNKSQVKKYCKRAANFTDVKWFNLYRSLCTRGTLIDQMNADLSSQNKSWLTSTTESDWNDLKTAYGDGQGKDLLIPSKEQEKIKVQRDNITLQLLMGWCSSVSSKLYVNTEEENYKVAKFNCTKESVKQPKSN